MQTRKIGSLDVSVVGLGCNNFGWRIDADASAKVIDAAIDSGITFFDTADRYGKGQSEDFLGRAIGCSTFSVAQIRAGADAAKGRANFVSVQNEFSLFHREPEKDSVLAECEARGIAFLPYFPLASGLLTGKYRKGQTQPEGSRA